jgi:hypothetical protein
VVENKSSVLKTNRALIENAIFARKMPWHCHCLAMQLPNTVKTVKTRSSIGFRTFQVKEVTFYLRSF